MEPILFYGVPSGCSFGSIVALEWIGQPYRLCRIEMPGQVQGELFRRINPVAETPALITPDRRVIAESMAILNHLAPRGIDQQLAFAQGTQGFDRLNQALAFLNTSFFNAFSPLWYALEHELSGPKRDVLRAYGAERVAKVHAELERMLGDGPWLLGPRRTFADAYFAGIARWTRYHDVINRSDYAAVQRLFDRLEADPAVQFAHAIERGEDPGGTAAFKGHVSLEEAVSLLGPAATPRP